MAMQINRDHATATDALGRAAAAAGKEAKDLAEAEAAFAKIHADSRADPAALAAAETVQEYCPQMWLKGVRDIFRCLCAMLCCCQSLEAARGHVGAAGAQDTPGLRKAYGGLKDAARDLATDTGAMVGDISACMERVRILHREATLSHFHVY